MRAEGRGPLGVSRRSDSASGLRGVALSVTQLLVAQPHVAKSNATSSHAQGLPWGKPQRNGTAVERTDLRTDRAVGIKARRSTAADRGTARRLLPEEWPGKIESLSTMDNGDWASTGLQPLIAA